MSCLIPNFTNYSLNFSINILSFTNYKYKTKTLFVLTSELAKNVPNDLKNQVKMYGEK